MLPQSCDYPRERGRGWREPDFGCFLPQLSTFAAMYPSPFVHELTVLHPIKLFYYIIIIVLKIPKGLLSCNVRAPFHVDEFLLMGCGWQFCEWCNLLACMQTLCLESIIPNEGLPVYSDVDLDDLMQFNSLLLPKTMLWGWLCGSMPVDHLLLCNRQLPARFKRVGQILTTSTCSPPHHCLSFPQLCLLVSVDIVMSCWLCWAIG